MHRPTQHQNSCSSNSASNRGERFIRMREVQLKTGLSRSALYERLNPASRRWDASFPKSVRLGTSARAVGFIESEVDEWMRNCINTSRSAG